MFGYICVCYNDNDLDDVLRINENLKHVNSKYSLYCLLLKGVSSSLYKYFNYCGIEYSIVEKNFNLLYLFSLKKFKKIVYLDNNSVINRNIDHLFKNNTISYCVSNIYSFPNILVIEPNIDYYYNLLSIKKKDDNLFINNSDIEIIDYYFKNKDVLSANEYCYSDLLPLKNDEPYVVDMRQNISGKFAFLLIYYNECVSEKKALTMPSCLDLISIIVPCYNCAADIDKCLNSILSQSYTNLEVICIDDCSTDDSLKILEDYALKDNRVKVLKNKVNMGVSHSRNVGLKNATGKYIGFVDSDDYIEEKMYEVLYNAIEKDDYDFVQCNTYVNDKKKSPLNECVYDSNSAIVDIFLNGSDIISPVVYDKLYNANFIKNYSFNEGFRKHEDSLFVSCFTIGAKKILFINKYLYHYQQKQVNSLSSVYNFDAEIKFNFIVENVEKFVCTNYPDKLKTFYRYKYDKIFYLLKILIKTVKDDVKCIYSNISCLSDLISEVYEIVVTFNDIVDKKYLYNMVEEFNDYYRVIVMNNDKLGKNKVDIHMFDIARKMNLLKLFGFNLK